MGLTIKNCHLCGEYKYLPNGVCCQSCMELKEPVVCMDCGTELTMVSDIVADDDGFGVCPECQCREFEEK